MPLDLYSSLEDITSKQPINYKDLYQIAKCMNVHYDIGNSLIYPISI
jgi:hypothetical protein